MPSHVKYIYYSIHHMDILLFYRVVPSIVIRLQRFRLNIHCRNNYVHHKIVHTYTKAHTFIHIHNSV